MLDRFRAFWRLWNVWDNAVEIASKEVPMDQAKSIFASWTFWANLAAGVYSTLEAFGIVNLVPAPYDTLVLAVGNILLRVKTTQPVALPGAAT